MLDFAQIHVVDGLVGFEEAVSAAFEGVLAGYGVAGGFAEVEVDEVGVFAAFAFDSLTHF